MARISERAFRREVMDQQMREIEQETGKTLFIGHLGSGNYWVGIYRSGNTGDYYQFSGNMKSKELEGFVAGMHKVLCGDAFKREE